MDRIINTFKTSIRIIGEKTREPEFETTADYSCEIVDGYYLVRVYNTTQEHIDELKTIYEWVSEETIVVPDPEVNNV